MLYGAPILQTGAELRMYVRTFVHQVEVEKALAVVGIAVLWVVCGCVGGFSS